MSYVALGAAAAPVFHPARLLATLAAFLLAVGVSAHALDELHGRPLGTKLSRGTLVFLSVGGLAGALSIGVVGALTVTPWLVPLIAIGGVAVPAYNLEWAGGRFHTGWVFALAWGGLPAFTGYFAQDVRVRPAGLLVVIACCLITVAQRRLSLPARELRRRTAHVSGQQRLKDGTVLSLDETRLVAPLDASLSALSVAMGVLAAGLVLARL